MSTDRQLGAREQRASSAALRTGLAMSGLDLPTLWAQCLVLDAIPDAAWLAAVLGGEQVRTVHEHDVIAQAFNDHFITADLDYRVDYADQLDTSVDSP